MSTVKTAALSSSLLSDPRSVRRFEDSVERSSSAAESDTDSFTVDAYAWSTGSGLSSSTDRKLNEILADQAFRIRVIFAPLDWPTKKVAPGIRKIYQHFSIPSEFLEERVCNVVPSFGALKASDDALLTWSHFISKNAIVANDGMDDRLYDPQFKDRNAIAHPQWRYLGFFSRWDSKRTELVVFGDVPRLKRRLQMLPDELTDLDECASDPFVLWTIVFDELWHELEGSLGPVRYVLGQWETNAITSELGAYRPDFEDITSLAKHIIYLRESITATSGALQAAIEEHSRHLASTKAASPPPQQQQMAENVGRKLGYLKRLLDGTGIRLASFDTRTQNLVQLCYNIIVQDDSATMLQESRSMRTIAFVTMVFLPAATISSICSTSFIYRSRAVVHVTPNYWIFWAATAVLTIVVFAVYFVYLYLSRASQWKEKRAKRHPSHRPRGLSELFKSQKAG